MNTNHKRCFRWGARLEKCPCLEIEGENMVCTMGGKGLNRIQYDAPDLASGRIVLVKALTCPCDNISLERWDGERWRDTKGGDAV